MPSDTIYINAPVFLDDGREAVHLSSRFSMWSDEDYFYQGHDSLVLFADGSVECVDRNTIHAVNGEKDLKKRPHLAAAREAWRKLDGETMRAQLDGIGYNALGQSPFYTATPRAARQPQLVEVEPTAPTPAHVPSIEQGSLF